jgi:dinuclear metal center YbgI/SA1388 family protein
MTLFEFNDYIEEYLQLKAYPQDPSQNGIQVQNSKPKEKAIQKIAYAVDACQASIEKAIEIGADILFVHHGLFWGKEAVLKGLHYNRIASLIQNDLALYAVHIPLDAHPEVGHNASIVKHLGLSNIEGFGSWRSMDIGFKGSFPKSKTLDEVSALLFKGSGKALQTMPFGKTNISSVGVISGGAGGDVWQAVEQNLDLYITGEISHDLYHFVKENNISVIAGGHYHTETFGLKNLLQKIEKDLHITGVFLDIPTNM